MNVVMMFEYFLLAMAFAVITAVFLHNENRCRYYVYARKLYQYTAVVHFAAGIVWLFIPVPVWCWYLSGMLLVFALGLWIFPYVQRCADFLRSVWQTKVWSR